MPNPNLTMLLTIALQALDEAEQFCPKPVLSTKTGQDIAIASTHLLAAYKREKGI